MNLTHKFDSETEEGFNFKTRRFMLLSASSLLALIVIEIWVIHTLSSFGEKVKKIEELQKNLKEENEILENEISRESSLPKIASSSASYGLESPKTVQYIR